MSVIDLVKEAEQKAEDLKNAVKAEADREIAELETAARREAADQIQAAKDNAAGILQAARQTAADNAANIRQQGQLKQKELSETAARNKEKAAACVLAFL